MVYDKKQQYFLKVCETGNITTAAEELFVSRSVLSRSLHELEQEFDTTLFIRSKQGVELTASGRIIRNMLQAFAANYKYARRQLDELQKQTVADTIHIGVTPTNSLSSYRRYLQFFMETHPEIRISIEEHSAFDICKLLMEHTLDVGISPVIYGAESLDTFVLHTDTLMLGMRKDDPLAQKETIGLADLPGLPLGFLTARVPMEGIINEYMDAQHQKPNIAVRTTDKELLYEMTMQGRVYPFLTTDMMAGWKDICYRRLSFITPSTIRLLWAASTKQRPAVNILIEYFMQMKANG